MDIVDLLGFESFLIFEKFLSLSLNEFLKSGIIQKLSHSVLCSNPCRSN